MHHLFTWLNLLRMMLSWKKWVSNLSLLEDTDIFCGFFFIKIIFSDAISLSETDDFDEAVREFYRNLQIFESTR